MSNITNHTCPPHLKLPHGLVESSEVAIVFGCLYVELSESFLGQLQRGEVQVVSLLQEALFCLFIVTVDGNFFQNQGCWGKTSKRG